jgi:hypothetical protein
VLPAALGWKRWRRWSLVAVVFPSDGAAPWELRRGSTARPSFAALRSPREGTPFAGVRVQADPAVDDLEIAVHGGQGGVAVRRARWRCSGTEERRLPVRDGGPPSPSVWRWCGRLRRRSVARDEDDARAQEGLMCNFLCFLGFSVRILAGCICNFPRKKKREARM